MCLGNADGIVTIDLKTSKKAWIRVWKVVSKGRYGGWFAPIQLIEYDNVIHNTGTNSFGKDAVHAFRTRESARSYIVGGSSWRKTREYVVEAYVRPEWIIAAGNAGQWQTISAEHMIVPLYPRKKLSARRVREIARQHGI